MIDSLPLWHEIVASKDPASLDELLSEDCVFYSPVVHSPQRGRDLTRMYLTGAMHVLGEGFHYVKEVSSGRHAILEFVCAVDGLEVNGVDIMTFDEAGRISEFKVMLRPLKAVNAVHAKMREMLEQLSG